MDSRTYTYEEANIHAGGGGGSVPVTKYTTTDDDGAVWHDISFDDSDPVENIDNVEVRLDPDDDSRLQVYGYSGDEQVYQETFERRDVSFTPASVVGRGETDEVEGSTPARDSSETVPESIAVALNTIGWAVVREGRWWIDE